MDKRFVALVLLIAPWCVWWLLIERKDISTKDALSNKALDSMVSKMIPNYGGVWYAKNLLWIDSQHRVEGLSKFGMDAEDVQYDWSRLCRLDSDKDGWTNGEELGDPCCIWHPGVKLPWWPSTHPCRPSDFPPASMRFNSSKCDTFLTTFASSSIAEDAFEVYYQKEHLEDLQAEHPWYLLCYSVIMFLWLRQSVTDATGIPSLSGLLHAALIFAGVFLFVDLLSAFLHAFLDNCSIFHPIFAGQCRGTQYHHYHPRSQSLLPMHQWFYNPIAVGVTIPVMLLLMLPRVMYKYPPQMNFAVTCMGLVWPLTYVFHEFAHLPTEQVPGWILGLQAIGVALHPDVHKAHHRQFNFTWSVLSGLMDFVPNFMARSVYDHHDSNQTCGIIIALVSLAWYAQLLFLDRWNTGGKPFSRSSIGCIAEKDVSV